MPLTGHLSDLSLSELIEFFCNQRKSGQLKVLYPQGAGYFFLQTGSVVDAKIGVLRGIDAVYYALTLLNAKFEFSGSAEAADRTINQPWTQVVLEGLRRLDEGITPQEAFPQGYESEKNQPETVEGDNTPRSKPQIHVPAFLTYIGKESMAKRKPLFAAAVVVAVLGTVAAVGVPAGWYNRTKVSAAATQSVVSVPVPEPALPATPDAQESEKAADTSAPADDAAAVKHQQERDRAKAREDRAARADQPNGGSSVTAANRPPAAANAGQKRITVTVSYDESGRVTQASGGDASAIRIARQKRFPPGKAGSATVTIPIN
ncbi:MAG: DUF4388 domain-containing protein [Pyrinomonadaceae bacterium]|nr:DUF4388 domain-containing protein [Pyrinomonadaceae bacterium]